MREDQDIEIVRGDTEVVLIPVADSDDPDDDFLTEPETTAEDVQYVIAEEFDDDSVLYDAPVDEIEIVEWQDVEPDNATERLPDDYPTLSDSQWLVQVIIPRDETAKLASTDGEDVDDLVHDCQITNDLGEQVTVMQGSVTVKPSATVEGRDG